MTKTFKIVTRHVMDRNCRIKTPAYQKSDSLLHNSFFFVCPNSYNFITDYFIFESVFFDVPQAVSQIQFLNK